MGSGFDRKFCFCEQNSVGCLLCHSLFGHKQIPNFMEHRFFSYRSQHGHMGLDEVLVFVPPTIQGYRTRRVKLRSGCVACLACYTGSAPLAAKSPRCLNRVLISFQVAISASFMTSPGDGSEFQVTGTATSWPSREPRKACIPVCKRICFGTQTICNNNASFSLSVYLFFLPLSAPLFDCRSLFLSLSRLAPVRLH